MLATALEHRKLFASAFVIFCVASLGLVFFLGQDFFPTIDAGLIRLHMRARPGLRVEETARLTDQVERVLRQEIPKNEMKTVLDNIGVPYSGLNLSYSTSGVIGTGDAEILIALDPEHHHPTAEYIHRLRQELPREGVLINAGAGGREMFDIAKVDPLRVYVSVPQAYAPAIKTGMKATITLQEFSKP